MSSFGIGGMGGAAGGAAGAAGGAGGGGWMNGLANMATAFNESNLRAPTGGAVGSVRPQSQSGAATGEDAIGEYIRKALDERFGPSGTVKPQGTRVSYDSPPPAPKKQFGIGYDL